MPLRIWLLLVALGCWSVATLVDVRGVNDAPAYPYVTSMLLAVGLFGSTVGIDLGEAKRHRRIIMSAITVGAVLKALLIGTAMLLITGDPLFLVLGVAVAQIDPLSVATLLGDDRLSARVKSILAAWASFDDPITVILVVYASAMATHTFRTGHHPPPTTTPGGGVLGLAVDLGLNLAVAAVAYLCWRTLHAHRWLRTMTLAVLGIVAVGQFLMLAVALAGLFVRTEWLETMVSKMTKGALLAAGALLGLLLVNGVRLGAGVALGLMAFLSQIVAAAALTRGLSRADRIHLALAQQNGITAIILALRLEAHFTGAVAVIAPAIVVTNLTHFGANWVADRGPRRRRPVSLDD